jgi:hypothetical protein
VNLAFPDARLRDLCAEPGRPLALACEEPLSRATIRAWNQAAEFRGGSTECTWDGLVEELRRVLQKTQPDVVVCPHPLVDQHPDHVCTTLALEEAVRGSAKEPVFLLYVVHVRDAPVYPFGPAEGWVALPPAMDAAWQADSIYSHPLAPDVQQLKYFAVERNHDERTYSYGAPRSTAQVAASIKRELGAFFGGEGLEPTSFRRRAPRPNEIFWVVSAKTLSEFAAHARARYRAVRG